MIEVRSASITSMFRHYVCPKGVVIFDHRHNAADRVERYQDGRQCAGLQAGGEGVRT